MATLHHQLVYRLQNHALDLPTPQTTSDALMILVDSSESIHSIVQIPRHIQKQELLKLMPLDWLSNYENFHKNSQLTPIVSHSPFEQSTPRNSFSYSSMITIVSTAQENLPIHGFASDGYPIYINGHFLWDVPGSHMCGPYCPCLEEEDDDDFNRHPRGRKKKSHKLDPCHKKPPLPPDDPDSLTPLPIYRKCLRLCKQEANQPVLHSTPIQSCMMFSPSSYQDQFPPLEKKTNPRTKNKEPMHQYSSQILPHLSESEESSSSQTEDTSTNEESFTSSNSEKELADASSSSPPQTPIVKEADSDTNPTAPLLENSSTKPSNSPWFTLDDIPKLIQAKISQVLALIYEQFLREATTANEQIRREFHIMKCCSLQIKDLDFHYKRMSTMYYKLNGFNDPSLKHVFIASLPKEIQPELQRQFTIHQWDITNLSLGKIYQLAVNCLERLCEHKEFFKDLMENKQPFKSACKNLISPLSARAKKIALVQQKRDPIFRNSRIQKKSQTSSRSRSRSKKPY
ncbi:hypothetical protein KPL70_007542 [Citrus sinensis]|nr:hypothetical protein KPL70_007542 [Citrus sinensis]